MPKLGTRERIIEQALALAEYGIEYVTYEAVAKRIGLTQGAVRKHFMVGGIEELRAEVFALARRRCNPFVLGQLWARRGVERR